MSYPTTSPAGFSTPGATGSPAYSNVESPMSVYIERTMQGIEDYARREPWAFGAWVFGIGFVLGWKLKPW